MPKQWFLLTLVVLMVGCKETTESDELATQSGRKKIQSSIEQRGTTQIYFHRVPYSKIDQKRTKDFGFYELDVRSVLGTGLFQGVYSAKAWYTDNKGSKNCLSYVKYLNDSYVWPGKANKVNFKIVGGAGLTCDPMTADAVGNGFLDLSEFGSQARKLYPAGFVELAIKGSRKFNRFKIYEDGRNRTLEFVGQGASGTQFQELVNGISGNSVVYTFANFDGSTGICNFSTMAKPKLTFTYTALTAGTGGWDINLDNAVSNCESSTRLDVTPTDEQLFGLLFALPY